MQEAGTLVHSTSASAMYSTHAMAIALTISWSCQLYEAFF